MGSFLPRHLVRSDPDAGHEKHMAGCPAKQEDAQGSGVPWGSQPRDSTSPPRTTSHTRTQSPARVLMCRTLHQLPAPGHQNSPETFKDITTSPTKTNYWKKELCSWLNPTEVAVSREKRLLLAGYLTHHVHTRQVDYSKRAFKTTQITSRCLSRPQARAGGAPGHRSSSEAPSPQQTPAISALAAPEFPGNPWVLSNLAHLFKLCSKLINK